MVQKAVTTGKFESGRKGVKTCAQQAVTSRPESCRRLFFCTKKRRDLESHARTTTRRMEEPYINPSPLGAGPKIESLI
jgi:hypothetical protein